MTKQDIINELSSSFPNMTKGGLKNILEAVFLAMIEAFRAGNDIHIKGFGHFRIDTVRRGLHRSGPNRLPRTVRFRASEELRKNL